MAEIDVVFFDIGGVILTNGWDGERRRQACSDFGLDWAEFEDRHQLVADRFETGRLDLEGYLERTVFYRERDFDASEFFEAMKNASDALGGGFELLTGLGHKNVVLATLNNESTALNGHRISRFKLTDHFAAFFSSCYLGVKKPDDDIFRIALSVMSVPPERTVFIDDRALNLECARRMGMNTIHHTSPESTAGLLSDLGV